MNAIWRAAPAVPEVLQPNMRLCANIKYPVCPHTSVRQAAPTNCHFTTHGQHRVLFPKLAQPVRSHRVACRASLGKVSKSASAPELPAPVQSLEAASLTMTSLVSKPAFLLAAAIGFSLIAFDVESPSSLHILPRYLDQPAHAWVKSHLPPAIKNLVAEKLVSDVFITGGIAGCVAAGVAGIAKSGGSGIKRLVIALLFYYFGGGSIEHGRCLLPAYTHAHMYACAVSMPCCALQVRVSGIATVDNQAVMLQGTHLW